MTQIPTAADAIEEKVAPRARTSGISKRPGKNIDSLEAPLAPERNEDPGKPD